MKRRRLARRNSLAYANPTSKSAVGGALGYLGLGAAVGGGLGAVGGSMAKPQDVLGGAVSGASVGVGAVAMAGIIVGLVDASARNVGFAAGGIGIGALILTNLVTNVVSQTKPAA